MHHDTDVAGLILGAEAKRGAEAAKEQAGAKSRAEEHAAASLQFIPYIRAKKPQALKISVIYNYYKYIYLIINYLSSNL